MFNFQPMNTKSGNNSTTHFEYMDDFGQHFLSYGSRVATIPHDESCYNITLYKPYWNMYSRTTNYYLLKFLQEDSIKDIRKKVNSGEYIVD